MTTEATTGTPTPVPTGGTSGVPSDNAVLQVDHLVVEFRSGRQRVQAVTDISFDLTGATVVLVDDVLFTGRTIRAALNAVSEYGRAQAVQAANVQYRSNSAVYAAPTK